MNKSVKKTICLALGFMFAFSAVGCGGGGDDSSSSSSSSGTEKTYTYEPESRPLTFASDALDGNFNPFFSTSAPDVNIAAQTQIGMLTTTTNSAGEDVIVCGKDWPTVALDYKIEEKTDTNDNTYTEYSFIIKNGIKFSDGVDLTIKDVLFNLYVYLDPQYTGSATLYSTKIKGLNAYRNQDASLNDDEDYDLDATFEAAANGRITAMTNYLVPEDGNTPEATEQVLADIAQLKTYFMEEVESYWTSFEGTVDSYDDYRFTEDWEVYYFGVGLIWERWQTFNEGGVKVTEKAKDKEDKIYTTLDIERDDDDPLLAERPFNDTNPNTYRQDMESAVAEIEARIAGTADNESMDWLEFAAEEGYPKAEEIETWLASHTGTDADSVAERKEYVQKQYAIYTLYSSYALSTPEKVAEILYWASGDKLYEQFVGEARTDYFDSRTEEEKVKNISGITTSKTTTDYSGNSLGEEHDVLKIAINGVDPKAIYNFAFTVAPLHYYSGTYTYTDKDGNEVTTDYVATADPAEHQYGVKTGDINFFNTVMRDPAKSGLPVGAGVYKAWNPNDNSDTNITKEEFYNNKWVYFQRNEYFYTVLGNNDESDNAKIKYIRYNEVGSNNILNRLQTEAIDIGQPSATADNIATINGISHLGSAYYLANGYGYVGVNPKYVPDIEIRQAIMKTMDVMYTIDYYSEKYATPIYRGMSITNWAYPKEGTEPVGQREDYANVTDTNLDDIRTLVSSAGYKASLDKDGDGAWSNENGDELEYYFTISGESEDHPAYTMFENAKYLLEQCGFKITIKTDPSALKKLASGELAVWAAAWSSALDPDLYQVWHKDSTATSIKNWGYEEIFKAGNEEQFGPKYPGDEDNEQWIINTLSEKIEYARTFTANGDRAPIYAECLELILDLYVELPTYQRNELFVYNKDVIDASTLYQGIPTASTGVIDKLWELDYN